MNCKQLEPEIISYTDGRAGDAARRAVESHLASCAACRARVAEFRAVWTALDEAPALDPSPSFDARLRQRIAAEPQRAWLRGLVPLGASLLSRPPRFALATAALALLSVWVAMRPQTTPQITPQRDQDKFVAIVDEQALEDYDVLAEFEPLSTLRPAEQQKDEI